MDEERVSGDTTPATISLIETYVIMFLERGRAEWTLNSSGTGFFLVHSDAGMTKKRRRS